MAKSSALGDAGSSPRMKHTPPAELYPQAEFLSTVRNIYLFVNVCRKFYNKYPRSIDELFYKRAVDFYYHSNASKEAFVYSVPFDAGER